MTRRQGIGRRFQRRLWRARMAHRRDRLALTLLRLALGVEFLWAFVDKLVGLDHATPSARAWIHGGSPTEGFLSGVCRRPATRPVQLARRRTRDRLAVHARPARHRHGPGPRRGHASVAAASGTLLLAMMWFATWPPATMAGGQPTGSNNPMVDDHVISALALIVVRRLRPHTVRATWGAGGRSWTWVQRAPWLR